MRIIAIIITLATLMPFTAHAEQKILRSGMQHIIVKQPDSPKTPEKPDVPAINSKNNDSTAERTEQQEKIWQKYRELAQGKATQTQKPAAQSSEPQTAKTESRPAPAENPVGIAGIISQYRQNKKQQSEMKTLRFTPPETKTTPETTN